MSPAWLTVVTVVYNDRQPLQRTLASVAAQSGRGIAHIVVDGGSTDGSAELARSAPHSPRVISGPDRGVYDAMNRGWQAADDGLIMYLNAGDTFVRNDVTDTLRAVARGAQWIRTSVVVVDSHGRRTRATQDPGFDPWAFRLGHQPVLHQGALMARSLLEELGGFDLSFRVAADYDLMIRAVEAGYLPRVLDIETVAMTTGGLSTVKWRSSLAEKRRIAERGQSMARRGQILVNHAQEFLGVGSRRVLRRSTETMLKGRAEDVIASLRH